MARHRSPQGRRTHLRLPLPPVAAAAGAGGGGLVVSSAPAGSIVGPRVIAAVLAGGALAAAGQAALTRALPVATDGAKMLKLSVQELVSGNSTATGVETAVHPVDPADAPAASVVAPLVAPLVALPEVPSAGSSAAEPPVVGVSELVKAADLHARAVAAAAGAVGVCAGPGGSGAVPLPFLPDPRARPDVPGGRVGPHRGFRSVSGL